MALKSPTAFHEYWGQVADATELPNISGATIQDAALQVGDIVWVADEDAMYQCTTATVGSAVWSRMMEDPNAIHDDVASEINGLTDHPSGRFLYAKFTLPGKRTYHPDSIASA